MKNQILDLYGILRAEYLHSHGRFSTDRLIRKLDCRSSENILEIGVGTGTTLALLASNYAMTSFYGTDLSALMLDTAQARLKFCGLTANTQLTLQSETSIIPFNDDFFDKVYVESVLAIQQGEALRDTLREISRILKPGGLLIMNETIWLDSTSIATAQEINMKCKSAFGIIQSNDTYTYVENWISLLEELQFNGVEATKLDGSGVEGGITFPFIAGILSNLFTGLGRFKAKLNPEVGKMQKLQSQQMAEITAGRQSLMDGYLISCRNG